MKRSGQRRHGETVRAGDQLRWRTIGPEDVGAFGGVSFTPERFHVLTWGAATGARVVALSVRWRGAGGARVRLVRDGVLRPQEGRELRELALLDIAPGDDAGNLLALLAAPYVVDNAAGLGPPTAELLIARDTMITEVTLYEQLDGDERPRLMAVQSMTEAELARFDALFDDDGDGGR